MIFAPYIPTAETVQSYGPAFRTFQHGWITLHIEGTPEERGIQHGRLMAPEIASVLRCISLINTTDTDFNTNTAIASGRYDTFKELAFSTFIDMTPQELIVEMSAIAVGADAAGARTPFGHHITYKDIMLINTYNEVLSLSSETAKYTSRCSAFIASGSATGGGIVAGHITAGDLYPTQQYNVYIDIVPTEGSRFAMQTKPGGVSSGTDWIINGSGLILTETTINKPSEYDSTGMATAWRSRIASQYGTSIQTAVSALTAYNTGMSNSEWLLGDIHTGEIAMLQLGLSSNRLRTSTKDEWVGGTTGFYWGCNNLKDVETRIQTVLSLSSKPSTPTLFYPSDRDIAWIELYKQYYGRIDDNFAVKALTTPSLVQGIGCDLKFTNSQLADQLTTIAQWGPGTNITITPSHTEYNLYKEIKSLPCNRMTALLAGNVPTLSAAFRPPATDLHNASAVNITLPEPFIINTADLNVFTNNTDTPVNYPWSGNIVPQTNEDVWFALAYVNYSEIIANDDIDMAISHCRSLYTTAVKARGGDIPLSAITPRFDSSEWYDISLGKGVLMLHTLRQWLGSNLVDSVMTDISNQALSSIDSTVTVSVSGFESMLIEAVLKDIPTTSAAEVRALVSYVIMTWRRSMSLPVLNVQSAKSETLSSNGSTIYSVSATIKSVTGPAIVPFIELNNASLGDSRLYSSYLNTASSGISGIGHILKWNQTYTYVLTSSFEPNWLLIDPNRVTAAVDNKAVDVDVFSCEYSIDQTVICCASVSSVDAPTARCMNTAALILQENIRQRTGIQVPIIRDVVVTTLRNKNIIVIGSQGFSKIFNLRAFSNALLNNIECVSSPFNRGYFIILKQYSFDSIDVYAHQESSFITSFVSPLNKSNFVTVIHGLSNTALLQAVKAYHPDVLPHDRTVALPHNQPPKGYIWYPLNYPINNGNN